MPQILCFGDSITYGSRDFEYSGWYGRLRRHLDSLRAADPGFYALTYNLGIPGEATDGLLKRFRNESQARIGQKSKEEPLFVFQFGANDACYIPSVGKFRVSKAEYVANLEQAVSQARALGGSVVILNITPVIDSTTEHPADQDKSRINLYVQEYNAALEAFCSAEGLPLADIYGAFAGHGDTLLCDDGLHPNAEGHAVIFETVMPLLPFHA